MKLSVAVASIQAPLDAFVVWRGFEQSVAKAADMGYEGVELALKAADEVDPAALSSILSRRGLDVSCISTGQVFAVLGLYFTHPDKVQRDRAIDVFRGLCDLAADFGGLVNVGRARGFVAEGQMFEMAEALFVDTARRILDYAAAKGVTLIIEPVNRYEINFVNSLDEGAALLAKVGRENIGLMPDVFHMNIEDARIGEALARHGGLVEYIHFADSNRMAPGWGHLDFDDVFDGLEKARYDGWASIEILPQPDPDSAARQAAEFMLPLLDDYNVRVSGGGN
ncbi:MAG: TIM barrel protein [Planctomycetota bacterium]